MYRNTLNNWLKRNDVRDSAHNIAKSKPFWRIVTGNKIIVTRDFNKAMNMMNADSITKLGG